MFTNFRFFAKGLFTFTLMAVSLLLLSPPLAKAETSIHKLKKKLHKLEHTSGEVLYQAGQVLGNALSTIAIEVCFDLNSDEDGQPASAAPKAGSSKSETAHPAHTPKPPSKSHPAMEK